ncbi:plasmid mobilization relaxosome protein MobC (plasmid) [Cellulosimicrobium cellulans]|nr:plasmid mobilization relaxosome protein MobC [Cellulosimicrobium cellulans]
MAHWACGPRWSGVAALGEQEQDDVTEQTTRARSQKRQRRANVPGGRRHYHRVGVTPEEEAMLLQRAAAAKVTVPRLLVESALAEHGETATDRAELLTELFHARRLLAAVSNNLNQVARATNATGEIQAELTDTLRNVTITSERVGRALRRFEVGA